VWLTVTKKLEVSQELNVLPTAMALSLNDFVASVMTGNASATTFYIRAKSLLIVIVKMLTTLYTVIYTPLLFFHVNGYFPQGLYRSWKSLESHGI